MKRKTVKYPSFWRVLFLTIEVSIILNMYKLNKLAKSRKKFVKSGKKLAKSGKKLAKSGKKLTHQKTLIKY